MLQAVKSAPTAVRHAARTVSYVPKVVHHTVARPNLLKDVRFDPEKYRPRQPETWGHEDLFRGDQFPFNNVQPGWGTKKSYISPEGVLTPVNLHGKTTAAQHIDGRPDYKADSPFTSMTSDLGVANAYGGMDNLISMASSSASKLLDQPALQRLIASSQEPGFKEKAVNRSMPGKPAWLPQSAPEKEAAKAVGIADDKPEYTFGERARINSHKDSEALLEGTAPATLWRGYKYRNAPPDFHEDNPKYAKHFQGRDPRNYFKGGYRIPLDEHSRKFLAHMERKRQEQAEIQAEREEDERERTRS